MDSHDVASRWFLKHEHDFDAKPEEYDRAQYAKALLICANGDGELADAEREWVIGYTAAVGATPETLADLRAYPADESIGAILARSAPVAASTRILVRDAIRACSADGTLDPTEIAAIRLMNAALGNPDDLVDTWLDFHAREQELRGRRLEIVWPGETKPY